MVKVKSLVLIKVLILSLWSMDSLAQMDFRKVKGVAVNLEFHKWDVKTMADLSFVKTFKNHLVLTTGISVGQFGNYIADRKTKNWYGNVQIPSFYGKSFYKSSDIGGQVNLRVGYIFILNKIFRFELNFGCVLGVYSHEHEYDYDGYDENFVWGYYIAKESSPQINFGFGFDSKFLIRLVKQMHATIGISMPYYIINQNDLDVSKNFNPPLLGLSPTATIGLRYSFKRL